MEFVSLLLAIVRYEKPVVVDGAARQRKRNEYDLIICPKSEYLTEEVLSSLIYDGFLICYGAADGSVKVDRDNYEMLRFAEQNTAVIKRNNGTPYCLNEVKSNLTVMSQRLVPPPAETLDHAAMIHSIAAAYRWKFQNKPYRYLELGVRNSPVIPKLTSVVDEIHGVDTGYANADGLTTLHSMSTDAFFARNTVLFQIIFIDADHSYEQVRRDLDNAFKHVDSKGFIFLHDTYPYSKDYIDPKYCSDAYKIVGHINATYVDGGLCDCITLPFNPGLTIVRKLF